MVYDTADIASISCINSDYLFTETSNSGLGFPAPEGGYQPLTDPEIPLRLRGLHLGSWVSSYYKHPIYTFPSGSSVKENRIMTNLQVRMPTAPHRPATMDTFNPEEMLACLDSAPGPRSEQAVFSIIRPTTLYEQTSSALHLNSNLGLENETPKKESSISLLPKLKIEVVYGYESVWSIQWAVWEIEKNIEKWNAEGGTIRPVKFTAAETANHFVRTL